MDDHGPKTWVNGLTEEQYDWVLRFCGIDLRDYLNRPVAASIGEVGASAIVYPSKPIAGALPLASAQTPAGAAKAQPSSKDKYNGIMVSNVTISLARKRAGFQTPIGMMLGDVDTDLQPGEYTLQPELRNQKWGITGPGVKSGLRFTVNLKDADPWVLAYPKALALSVSAGLAKEPATFGDMHDASGKDKDPLWLYEGMQLKEPIAGPDDFEDIHFDLGYRSDKGNLSKFLQVNYRDNSHKDINLDDISKATPRLFAAKQEALKVMDDYNTNFILGSFPAVFFIITISPLVAPTEGSSPVSYSANRKGVPKSMPPGETTEPSGPTEPGGVSDTDVPGAAPKLAEPLKPGKGIEMYGEAVKRVKLMPPGERVGCFKEFMGEIKVSTNGQWQAKASTLADGGTMFAGEGGQALVFDPQGNLFRGSLSNIGGPEAQFSFGKGGILIPNYTNLLPR